MSKCKEQGFQTNKESWENQDVEESTWKWKTETKEE